MNTETPQQLETARRLYLLQTEILKTQDRNTIVRHINDAIAIALPVPPYVNEARNNAASRLESKERAIGLLRGDIPIAENETYYDIDTVHFQVCVTIAMLIDIFIDVVGNNWRTLKIK